MEQVHIKYHQTKEYKEKCAKRQKEKYKSGEWKPPKFWKGKKRSQETIDKIKATKRRQKIITPTSFKKGDPRLMGKNNPNFGKHLPDKTKQKISDNLKGRFAGEKNPMFGKKHTEEELEKMSENHKGQKAWNKGLTAEEDSRIPAGEKNANWKGGITPENYKLRQTKIYNDWRFAVYRRDHYICQTCKKKCNRKEIVAHHIKSFKDFPELRYEVDNGITMCRSCHIKLHQKQGY